MNAGGELEIVVFRVGAEEYALELYEVREITRVPELEPLAAPAPPALGMAMLDSERLPIVSLPGQLGFADREPAYGRLLVTRHPAGLSIGLLVEAVSEVVAVPITALTPPPPMFSGHGSSRVRSLVAMPDDRLVVLVSVQDLFSRTEVERLTAARPATPAAADNPDSAQDLQ